MKKAPSKSEKMLERLLESRLIALLNPKSVEDCLRAYEELEPENVVLEIVFRSPSAAEGLAAVIGKYPRALVLAGTILSRTQAEQAVQLGAAGVVSPDYIPEVVDTCARHDIMCVPGGLSDAGKQLVQKASHHNCSLEDLRRSYPYQWVYKLFPAFTESSDHLDIAKAMRGPYPGLHIIYTGGVTLKNLPAAADKDPAGIFCASALTANLSERERFREDIRCWRTALGAGKPAGPGPVRSLKKSGARCPKIVTFGEIMLRLSPQPGIRLAQALNFDVTFGGAEANVAASLAHLGAESVFVTALPSNDLGRGAQAFLRQHGIRTDSVVWKNSRMGIYYLEHGSGPRPSKVIYDRARSAASEIVSGDLNWEVILRDSDWFHWTGITPALSDTTAETLREGLVTAKKNGIPVSVDLNFRGKLWDEKKARRVMTELMPFVDVCIGNEEDSSRIFGIRPPGTDVEKGEIDVEGYREVCQKLSSMFHFEKVAMTLRESLSASENIWSACLLSGREFYQSRKYKLNIIDRVGAGDAFAAGLIFSMIQGKADLEALEFGVAAACLKHTIQGDFNPVSAQEVSRLAEGEASGRIQR